MISNLYFENFFDFIDLLNNHNIEYWLTSGNLLGIVREGKFLSHDVDIDIGLWAKDYDKIKKIIRCSHKWELYSIWRREIGIIAGVKKHSKIDLFFHDSDETYVYQYSYKRNVDAKWNVEWRIRYPKEYLKEFKEVEYKDHKISIPKESEKVLTVLYGDTWKVPNKKWKTDDSKTDKDYRAIAIIIPHFMRTEKLKLEIESIQKYMHKDSYRLYIGAQGEDLLEDSFFQDLENEGHVLISLPENYGLSATRNVLLDKVQMEPYILTIDDDFTFNKDSDIDKFVRILNHDESIGIVGGTLENRDPYNHRLFYDKIGKKLYYIKTKEEKLYTDDTTIVSKIEYNLTDLVLNFSLSRREVWDDVRWDDSLKLCEHSVVGTTPVIIQDGFKNFKSIEINKLFPDSLKQQNCTKHLFKNQTVKIWTDKGWQKILGIFRHKSNKEMIRLHTPNSYIDCTTDHSLIINNKEVKPSELKLGDKIERIAFPKLSNNLKVDLDWAWLLGFFLAEGNLHRSNGVKISITNQNKVLLNKSLDIFAKFGIKSHILNTSKRKDNCLFLCVDHSKYITDYFDAFYIDNSKTIPSFVYEFDFLSREAFIQGFYDGDGIKSPNPPMIFCQKRETIVNGILWLSSDIFTKYSITKKKNKFGEWFNFSLKKYTTKKDDTITKIEKYFLDDYVYDIETENHHFCGGLGNVNLHNTDFFVRLKSLNTYKVAVTNEVSAGHQKHNDSTEYHKYRRIINKNSGWKLFCQKMNMSSVADIVKFEDSIYNIKYKEITEDDIKRLEQKEKIKIIEKKEVKALPPIVVHPTTEVNNNYVLEELNRQQIKYFLIEDTCRDVVKYKSEYFTDIIKLGFKSSNEYNKAVTVLITLKYICENSIWKKENNKIVAKICTDVGLTKAWRLMGVLVQVPNPVLGYLTRLFGESWNK